MLYSIKFIKTNEIYDVFPNVKIIDKLTSDLDMFEFTLKPIETELDLDFSKNNGLIPLVLYVGGEEYRVMYLTYYKKVIVSYSPKTYKYMFQATSPTHVLQRITLPNKLITQPITDNKRTVYDELVKIMEVYADDISIDLDLQTLLNVPCPELQFVKSTLHEVLITLFAVCGLVPKMNYLNELSYIDLKISDNAVKWNSSELFIREEEENNVENYADAFDFDIENILSDEKDITTQWLAPTSDNYNVTTDDFIWKTPSEIYEIVKVEALLNVYYSLIPQQPSTEYISVDITNYVVPKKIWETFKTSSTLGYVSGKYKRNYLYYEGNVINGNYDESSFLDFLNNDKAIRNAVYWSMKNNPLVDSVDVNTNPTPYRDILLKVTYKTQANNLRVKIVKDGIVKPINNLINNQNESYIDANNFGNQNQELINRMGNEMITAQARIDLSDVIYVQSLRIGQLGEVVDDHYIITEREMLFSENNLLINYKLAKDYVLLTNFSGVNQIKRFTSIDTENTVIRNDIFVYNYKLEKTDREFIDDFFANQLITDYGTTQKNGKNLHYVKTYDSNINALQDFHILVNSQNKVIGNNIVCNFKFETNAKVGDSINVDNNIYIKEPIRYTDDNGEFKYLDLYFGAGEEQRNVEDLDVVRKHPVVENVSDDFIVESFLINKDNREITSITLQFRIVGDNEEVFVKQDFLKYTTITAHDSTTFKIYTAYYEDLEDYEQNKYTKTSINYKGTLATASSIVFANNVVNIRNVALEQGYWVIGVCDENDNLILAINHLRTGTDANVNLYLSRIL